MDFFMHTATRQEFAGQRKSFQQDMSLLRTQVRQGHDNLRHELQEAVNRLSDKIDSNLKWILSILLISILSPIALHFVT